MKYILLLWLVLLSAFMANAQGVAVRTNLDQTIWDNKTFKDNTIFEGGMTGNATGITNAPYWAGGIPTFNRNWSHDLNTTNAATTIFPFGLVRATAGAGNSLFTTDGFLSTRAITTAGNSYYLLAPTNKGGIRRIEVKGRWMYTNDGGLDQQKYFNVSVSKVSMDDGDGTFGLNGPNLHINARSYSLSVDINTNGLNQYAGEGWLPYNYTGIDTAKYITNGQEFLFILDFPADNEMVLEHMGETRKITLNYLTNITRSAFCWLEFLHDGNNGWVEISDFRYYNASFLTPSGPNLSNSVVSVGGAQNPPTYRDSTYSGAFFGGAPDAFGVTNVFTAQSNGVFNARASGTGGHVTIRGYIGLDSFGAMYFGTPSANSFALAGTSTQTILNGVNSVVFQIGASQIGIFNGGGFLISLPVLFTGSSTSAVHTATSLIAGSGGIASASTNATLTMAPGGITNTTTIEYTIYGFTGTGVVLTNLSRPISIPLGTITAPQNITLQANDALMGTLCAAAGDRGF